MFLFYYVVSFSRKLSEKILLALGPGFAKNFRERTLGIWDLRSFDVFWCCSCLCFCIILWCYSPESCPQKLSYLLVHSLASVSLPVCLSVCLVGSGLPVEPKRRAPRRVRQSVSQSCNDVGVVPGRLLAAPPDNSPPAISMSELCQVSFAVLSVSVCFFVMPFFRDGVGWVLA